MIRPDMPRPWLALMRITVVTIVIGACAIQPALARPRGDVAVHVISSPKTGLPATILYPIKSGDTLIKLDRAGLVGGDAVLQLEKINHITNPRLLPVGMLLRIPRALLRDEGTYARVTNFSGAVTLIVGGQNLSARKGSSLGEGGEIVTGNDSFVTLQLADGTLMSLPSSSHVRLARLRRVLLTGSVERSVALQVGRVRSAVTPMHDPNSSFRITTPITVSAVRGTHFRVDYTPGSGPSSEPHATTAVDGGKVAVNHVFHAKIGTMAGARAPEGALVTAGFGVASTDDTDSGSVALLIAPKLANPDNVQTGANLQFELWPLIGATAYRVQVARDAGALDVISEVLNASPLLTLPSVPAGDYFLRVAAIDSHGIEGLSDSYNFVRQQNQLSGTMSSGGSRHERRYVFAWQATSDGTPHFHFRLMRKAEGATKVGAITGATSLIDEVGLTGDSLTVTNLPAGDYLWQVSSSLMLNGRVVETWTPAQSVHIVSG